MGVNQLLFSVEHLLICIFGFHDLALSWSIIEKLHYASLLLVQYHPDLRLPLRLRDPLALL